MNLRLSTLAAAALLLVSGFGADLASAAYPGRAGVLTFESSWVQVVAPGGGRAQVVSPVIETRAGAWSPDGRWLAWADEIGITLSAQIVVRAQGRGPVEVGRPFRKLRVLEWSPDGTSLLVVAGVGREFAAVVVDRESGERRVVRARDG